MIPTEKFRVGDHVVAVRGNPQGNYSIYTGSTGTVCNFECGLVGVCWDDEVVNGHECDGTCEDGHGWYVESDAIQLATEEDAADIEDDSFLNVIGGAK